MSIMFLVPLFKKVPTSEFSVVMMMIFLPFMYLSWPQPRVMFISMYWDKLSLMMIILSIWMLILMTLVLPKNTSNLMKLTVFVLFIFLLMYFSVSSILSFFILFEASLIPTLMLIIGGGYQPERLEASYYFFFYTVMFSTPLMVSLLSMLFINNSKYFIYECGSMKYGGIISLYILLVFLIKLPIFLLHFWLPKAHVEAPVVGSMVLAGVLLKTGGYGVMRFLDYMEKTMVSWAAVSVSVVGMIYICFVCLSTIDLKQLIAYSSVSHMNFLIAGLMFNSTTSYNGGVIMMVSHGLCSSMMFFLADSIYKRSNSRSLLINKGFLLFAPLITLWLAMTSMFNMGFPPTPGCISELMIMSVLSSSVDFMKIFMMLYLFFGAFYSMQMYMNISHGVNMSMLKLVCMNIKDNFVVLNHIFPLTSMILMMKLFLL